MCLQVSAESGHAVEWIEEDNYMFRLSEMQAPLEAWLRARDGQLPVQPAPYHSEVGREAGARGAGRGSHADAGAALRAAQILRRVEGGLTDLSVSRPRSRVQWGIPVPGSRCGRVAPAPPVHFARDGPADPQTTLTTPSTCGSMR